MLSKGKVDELHSSREMIEAAVARLVVMRRRRGSTMCKVESDWMMSDRGRDRDQDQDVRQAGTS